MTAVEAGGASAQGGIPILNRLILDALRDAPDPTPLAVGSLLDNGRTGWARGWPVAFAAAGSRARFALQSWRHRQHGRDSLVFATHLSLAPLARLVAGRRGRMGVFLLGSEAWRPLRPRELWGMRRADFVASISALTLREFREHNPALARIAGQICHLPARDLPRPEGPPDAGPRAQGPGPHVLIVGRLWGRGMRKGQRQLIQIWPDVLKAHPTAQLWIVGGGPGRAEFEEQARSAGVAASVVFPGEISDLELARLYAASDVYAMPSEGEGFGLVFAEAMASGRPCICSKFDGGSEVVEDGVTGLHVDPADLDGLREALLRLLGDPDLRADMGRAGRDRVELMFRPEAFRNRLRQLLSA